MAEKFGDMPGDRVFTLMDDFVRFTPAKEGVSRADLEMDHVKLLDEFLTRVEAMRLKLKLPKAEHAVEEIEALGMRYGHGKMEKTGWTTSVIQDYPAPRTAKQMERFLAWDSTTETLWRTTQHWLCLCESCKRRSDGTKPTWQKEARRDSCLSA